MKEPTLDEAIQSFKHWAAGGDGFDELELKEVIDNHIRQLFVDVLGKETDLVHKYEAFDGIEGIHTTIDDNDSEDITGEKLAHLANFVADKTVNEIWEIVRKKGY